MTRNAGQPAPDSRAPHPGDAASTAEHAAPAGPAAAGGGAPADGAAAPGGSADAGGSEVAGSTTGGATAAAGAATVGGPGSAGGAEESEPDARFTFANERTFLAWHRTALALIVAGLAVVQLLPPFPGIPFGRHLLAVPLIVLGGALSVGSYLEWTRHQRALRRGEPLGRSVLPAVLAVAITALSIAAAVLSLLAPGSGT